MEDTSRVFGLCPEQDMAFRIIANHAAGDHPQLKIYIGGMAGTGKSQVIKALKYFFLQRGETHRLQIVAPTGSAAALVGGVDIHDTGTYTQVVKIPE